jgi:LacI family transcriptional regulator
VKQGPVTKPTVRAVAAAAGVSIATVSRVLNSQGNVAAETRALVERVMAGLDGPGPYPRGGPRPIAGSVFVRCPYVLTDYFGR